MGIVFITVAGDAQRAFANALYEKTGGAVSLVIIQKPKRFSMWSRFRRFYIAAGLRNFFTECRYGILLRLDNKTRRALGYFHEHSGTLHAGSKFLPPMREVESINSDEAFKLLQKHSPELLVIWGGAVLQPRILKTAKRAINLHFGLAPHYRGAVANQFALFRGDIARIGATIHYAEEKVDAGAILETIAADTTKPPRELFRDLNDRARARYLEIAERLFRGEHLPVTAQDILRGEFFLLKSWNRETRYKLGKKMLRWERRVLRDSA